MEHQPIVEWVPLDGGAVESVTLHEAVAADGWAKALRECPEIRRLISNIQALRQGGDPGAS